MPVILSRQPEIVHAAFIIHLPLALAVRNLGTQIRQGNVWTKSPDEMLLAVLPGASALLTSELHHVAGMVFEFERAGHGKS